MNALRLLTPFLKWFSALTLIIGIVVCVRSFLIESFQISTSSMEETLHQGDYILVDKRPNIQESYQNKVVLFTSPLQRDSSRHPLFISRCIGMPGDTILINDEGYIINGQKIPRSPLALTSFFITSKHKDYLLKVLDKLQIPLRDFTKEEFGFQLSLTSFEEYEVREELSEEINRLLVTQQARDYRLIVPQKNRAYPLDSSSLIACKEIILKETEGKASFRNGKLYLDGRETNYFFFQQDYFWVLSDNINEAIDSRHLGFIPADHILGKAWIYWYSANKQKIFKTVK